MTVVRPFPIGDGPLVVQLITLGPGFCGGDRIDLDITADAGANVVVTTTAATRVLSMHPGLHAEQHVRIAAARDATIQYYPLVTIPFPGSTLVQRVRVDAVTGARVGVMEAWALGRTARHEHLQFHTLSNRTTLHVDGTLAYADATELQTQEHDLNGAGVLAGRRYLASGFWLGATVGSDHREGASQEDLLCVFGQSRPGIAYRRASARRGAPPRLRSHRRRVGSAAALAGSLPVLRRHIVAGHLRNARVRARTAINPMRGSGGSASRRTCTPARNARRVS